MPTLSYDITNLNRGLKRPPIFYVSRNKFSGQGTQGQSNVVPLISEPRSLVSRYSRAVVENITINIDDQANIATVIFPKDLHDAVSGNIVGDEIKIRLAAFAGFPSEIIFRGIVLQPSFVLSPSEDGITYDCVGYRYLLNADVIFGLRNFDAPTVHETFSPTIFNEDDRPDRSATRKTVNGVSTFLFDKENKNENAVLWTVADIIGYIIAVEVGSKISKAVNVPDIDYLSPLNFVPKHFELQNEQIATGITRAIQQMGPAYHWWLDDFFSHQGGTQSNFRWFVIGGIDNTQAGQRINDESVFTVGIPAFRDSRRIFTIGKTGEKVEDHLEYNVGTINITEDGSDLVNRLIVIGDFIRVETTFQLTKDWTAAEETSFEIILPDDYPGIIDDSADPEDVTKLKTALADAQFENVFRSFKLDATDISAIFDDIESELDSKFGAPKDINGNTIKWFDRDKLPPFDRELFTQQEDVNGNKQDIRMQVYGFTDARRKDPDDTGTRLISRAFGSWTLGTHRNSYVIDPEQPKIRFKKLVADSSLAVEGLVYVTAVIPTQVRVFHDTGKLGDAQITVTRILEEERFKRILRFKSLVPERLVDNVKPTSLDSPSKNVKPISIIDYKENDEASVAQDKETGYKALNKTASEIVRDDITELTDFANDSADSLSRTEVATNIRIPQATATYKPGELIKKVHNSAYKRFQDSTIVSVSINGQDFSTQVNTTNKKV